MKVKPWMLLVLGATLDLAVAVALIVLGLTLFGAFMAVLAVACYGLAFWMRANQL